MCSGFVCGIVTVAIGSALVIASSLVGYYVIPGVVEDQIINEVILLNDTEQFERFQAVPFPLTFAVRIFNVSNAEEAQAGGVPDLTEVGPYVYKLYHQRLLETVEEDKLTYRIMMKAEFDPEASYPHTEDDLLTVVNVAYHGVLQVAASTMPGLLGILNSALNGIFGADNNGPIVETRVGDLLFEGITLCQNPGLLGSIACNVIRSMTEDIQNMEVQPDGSIKFSVFGYRDGIPSKVYEVYRGIENHEDLARIITLAGEPALAYWPLDITSDEPTACNMINGTDSGIFAPFVDRTKSLYAINMDICRSVELRHQYDVEYKGIPAARFTANEWFLDDEHGCFCLNLTSGLDGQTCLLRGAQELYTCVGAYMVLSYPHFLYADDRYRNGVLGMRPVIEDHRLFLDIEPNTGTVVRGAKRAQFNVFMRAIAGIPSTENLRTTLTPVLWLEESVALTDEYASLLTDDLIATLNLINILVPVAVALSAAVLLTGIIIVICVKTKKTST